MQQQVETTVNEIFDEMNESQIFEMICLAIKYEYFDIEKYNKGEYRMGNVADNYKKNRDSKDITLSSYEDIEIEDIFDELTNREKKEFIKQIIEEGWFDDSDHYEHASEEEFDRKVLSLVGCRRYISKEKEHQLLDFIKNIDN